MKCSHCENEILDQEGQKYILIELGVKTGEGTHYPPVGLGHSYYHLDCFKEFAGEQYIPQQYAQYKNEDKSSLSIFDECYGAVKIKEFVK